MMVEPNNDREQEQEQGEDLILFYQGISFAKHLRSRVISIKYPEMETEETPLSICLVQLRTTPLTKRY